MLMHAFLPLIYTVLICTAYYAYAASPLLHRIIFFYLSSRDTKITTVVHNTIIIMSKSSQKEDNDNNNNNNNHNDKENGGIDSSSSSSLYSDLNYIAAASAPTKEQKEYRLQKKQLEQLKNENEILKRNISILYRTAKKELERKDVRIQQLEKELDEQQTIHSTKNRP